MSELKEHLFCECDEIFREYRGQLSNEKRPYYLKYEADKVIAELKDKIRAGEEQIKNLINSASNIMLFQDKVKDDKCKELTHQKRKRCLAMARWCRTSSRWDESLGAFKYRDWYCKWFMRWMELAEKFKDKEA